MTDILDINLNDVVEPRTAEADEELEVRIVDCKKANDKNDLPYILPRFEVVSDDYAKEFSHFIRLPHDGMSPKELNKAKYNLKRFYDTFNVDYSRPVAPDEDLPGKTGFAILGVKDDEYAGEEVNYIKKFIPRR